MKGFVPTPPSLAEEMVERLFSRSLPNASDLLIDPGCGDGVFIAAVLQWCSRRGLSPPRILGVELHPERARLASERFRDHPNIVIDQADFLSSDLPQARFIVGNPPYVSVSALSVPERDQYRQTFRSARGRFDLYMLFIERAVHRLDDGGRLVFVVPEKLLYVDSARSLWNSLETLVNVDVQSLDVKTFPNHLAYPMLFIADRQGPHDATAKDLQATLAERHRVWGIESESRHARASSKETVPLGSLARTIAAGPATGAEKIFVLPTEELPDELRPYSLPAVAGRDLCDSYASGSESRSILMPYDRTGCLVPLEQLGALATYLRKPAHKAQLLRRSRPTAAEWWGFHDRPKLEELMLPKIIVADLSRTPMFYLDQLGTSVPLHSAYYIVPKKGIDLRRLCRHLNSDETQNWLLQRSAPAAAGYRRIKVSLLKQIGITTTLSREG